MNTSQNRRDSTLIPHADPLLFNGQRSGSCRRVTSFVQPVPQNFVAGTDELRVGAVALQHAYAVDEGPHDTSQQSRVALTDLASLLGFANDFLQHCEYPAGFRRRTAACFEQ